jgi:hypothetical protein
LLRNIQLIEEKSSTKSNQEKGTPLLEVLTATRYAGAIFTGNRKRRMEWDRVFTFDLEM